jgi:hypothetical protein
MCLFLPPWSGFLKASSLFHTFFNLKSPETKKQELKHCIAAGIKNPRKQRFLGFEKCSSKSIFY